MPGKVVKVLVAEGDSIEAGTPVVVVEAMMETELVDREAGVVQKCMCSPETPSKAARSRTVG